MAIMAVSLIGSAIGGAIGGTFLGVAAASWGYLAGSLIGNALFTPDLPGVSGPRVSDLRVQTSTTGQTIPRIYRKMRIAGNVIWAPPIREVKKSKSVGGGKGGGPSQTQTTYHYYADLAIGLCDCRRGRPIRGITRIWANGEVVYDIGDRIGLDSGGSGSTWQQAVNAIAERSFASNQFKARRMRVYTGTTTQEPDALIETDLGVGLTPAFRGLAYVVIDDLYLEKYGNRIPNLEFEVITDADAGYCMMKGAEMALSSGSDSAAPLDVEFDNGKAYWVGAYQNNFIIWTWNGIGDPRVYVKRTNIAITEATPVTGLVPTGGGRFAFSMQRISGIAQKDSVHYYNNVSYSSISGDLTYYNPTDNQISDDSAYYAWGMWKTNSDPLTDTFGARVEGFSVGPRYMCLLNAASGEAAQFYQHDVNSGTSNEYFEFTAHPNRIIDERGRQYFVGETRAGNGILIRMDENGRTFTVFEATSPGMGFDAGNRKQRWSFYYPEYGEVWAMLDENTFDTYGYARFDEDGFVGWSVATLGAWTVTTRIAVPLDDGGLLFVDNLQGNEGQFHFFRPDGTLEKTLDSDPRFSLDIGGTNVRDVRRLGKQLFICADAIQDSSSGSVVEYEGALVVSLEETIAGGSVTVGDVVSDLCAQTDLDPSQYDASDLTDEIGGYAVMTIGSARSAIEVLQSAYSFDAVEVDGVITFVKRNNASVMTLEKDDLIPMDQNGQVLSMRRAQDLELPNEVAVSYYSDDASYMQGLQYDRRLITDAVNKVQISLPMVFTDQQAADIAARLNHDAWLTRTTYRFKTHLHAAKIVPTDIVTVDMGNASHVIRITSRKEAGNAIEFEGTAYSAATYQQTGAASPLTPPNEDLSGTNFADLIVFNCPPLRNAHDHPGFYVAAGPQNPGGAWPGAEILESRTGGQSYQSLAAVDEDVVTGIVTNALGNWTGGNTFDMTNTLTVTLYSGSLESVTDDQLLQGANAFVVFGEDGPEVLQAGIATLVSGMTYTLSRLLRGRKGTEYAMGGHYANSTFLLLNEEVQFIQDELGMIDVSRMVTAVPFGMALENGDAMVFSNNGETLKPLSVAGVQAGQGASSALVLNWLRRARVNADWYGAEIPLDEDTEAYEIDFYDSTFATFKRTAEVSDDTYTYSGADQTTDFGSPPASIGVRIYQMSAQVGRGQVKQLVWTRPS